MIGTILPTIIGIAGKAIDKVVPDKGEAERIKAEITVAAMQHDASELESAVRVILAEANGNWIQRSWRPLLMFWFAGLIGAHWLGVTPENLDKDHVDKLLGIVQVGMGGYILGRSGEKMVKEWKNK